MSFPIGQAVSLDPDRLREHEERQTGGPAAGVVLPKRLDPADPEKLLAGLAGRPILEALEVCEVRIDAAYAEARRWELVRLSLQRVRRGAE